MAATQNQGPAALPLCCPAGLSSARGAPRAPPPAPGALGPPARRRPPPGTAWDYPLFTAWGAAGRWYRAKGPMAGQVMYFQMTQTQLVWW